MSVYHIHGAEGVLNYPETYLTTQENTHNLYKCLIE